MGPAVKRLLAVASLIWLTVLPAHAAEQITSLKTLCDRICGGMWKPAPQAVSDESVTTYTYEWDASLNLVRGKAITSGGFSGVRLETVILFGVDNVAKTIWFFEGSGYGLPRYGTVEFTPDGYREITGILGSDEGKRTFTYVFTGADEYQVAGEFMTRNGPLTSSTAAYQRTWP